VTLGDGGCGKVRLSILILGLLKEANKADITINGLYQRWVARRTTWACTLNQRRSGRCRYASLISRLLSHRIRANSL
jgi:hypothetical protein